MFFPGYGTLDNRDSNLGLTNGDPHGSSNGRGVMVAAGGPPNGSSNGPPTVLRSPGGHLLFSLLHWGAASLLAPLLAFMAPLPGATP